MDVERIEQRFAGLQSEIDALKEMVDTERGVITAQYVKIDDPVSPQIIRVSEGGSLELGSGGSWKIIDTINEDLSHTGDTDETAVGKIVAPGNCMGPKGFLRIAASFRGMGAGTHYFYVYYGVTQISYKYWTGTSLQLDIMPKLIWAQGSDQLQSSSIKDPYMHGKFGEAPLAMSEDTTQDIDIEFRVRNSIAGDIGYLRSALVEACYRD